MRDLRTEEGRNAFGEDAANYDAARPDYPGWGFACLRDRCGLKPGTRSFEIGPGTGQATAKLLELGAEPLVAIEPDVRLAAFLERKFAGRVTVVKTTFEDAPLAADSFDLGTAATSFHWVEQGTALNKVAAVLRSGGWWAAWWNVFGDPEREDAFHEATRELLKKEADSPGQYTVQARPSSRERDARLTDIDSIAAFETAQFEVRKWTLTLTTAQMRALYATFSQFSIVEPVERERILDGLARIAEVEFGGRVERNMCTELYTARRR